MDPNFFQILKKENIVDNPKTMEHTLSERKVLEAIRNCPFLGWCDNCNSKPTVKFYFSVSLQYAFQSDCKLHLVMGMVWFDFT